MTRGTRAPLLGRASEGQLSAHTDTARAAVAAAMATVLAATALAAVAPAADAPVPRPVVTISARVSPGTRPIPKDVPLTVKLDTAFSSTPPGGDLVLQRATYLFGDGARVNGALFPACSAAKLQQAHGRLSVCPPGSKIGTGIATGRAVAIGVTSSGKITIFNGPGGRSLVLNLLVVSPALIDATFSAPITRLRGGRYAFELSSAVPPELQRILDGDIVVERLAITTGATRVISGHRRGYFEAVSCPPDGGSAIRGEFTYKGGVTATADAIVPC